MHGAGSDGCVFCEIVGGTSPARWVRNDPDSGFVVFHNRLKWSEVMLLVVPREHMTQEQLWSSPLLPEAGGIGLEVGDEHCPGAYRVLSNFGRWAHQSQEHAHIHVISGLAKNLEDGRPNGSGSVVEGVCLEPFDIARTPAAIRIAPVGIETQRELWSGEPLLMASKVALALAAQRSHSGFRLASNFAGPDGGTAGLFLLGGGQLDLYI